MFMILVANTFVGLFLQIDLFLSSYETTHLIFI
jgi:hypothetical protein